MHQGAALRWCRHPPGRAGPGRFLIAASKDLRTRALGSHSYNQARTNSGVRYARVLKGDEVLLVVKCCGKDNIYGISLK